MKEIKLKDSGFHKAKLQQTSAITELQDIYNMQKRAFKALKKSWHGKSGDAFRQGSNELLCETLMAQLALEDLNKKTLYAYSTMKYADETLKRDIVEK